MKRGAELVAIVLGFCVARELIGRAATAIWRAFPDRDLGAVPFYAMWIVLLAVVARFLPRPRLWPPREVWHGERARTIATLALVVSALVAIDSLYGFLVGRALVGDFNFHWPTMFVVNGVIAGIVEEWLFRGVMWDAFAERLPASVAVAGALVITSLLFGIFHWASMLHPSWVDGSGGSVVAHVEFGAFVGIVRWRLRAIAPGMIIHVVWNTVAMLTY